MSDVTDLVERFRAFAHQWLKGSLRDDDIYTFTDATGEHTIRASDLLSAAAALASIKQTDTRPADDVDWDEIRRVAEAACDDPDADLQWVIDIVRDELTPATVKQTDAVEAERERCARIAERFSRTMHSPDHTDTGKNIAAAIRGAK